jgi:beta-galactosidase/beta-glucuronidase
MASSSQPPSVLDLQALKDAAYRNLGLQQAAADYAETSGRSAWQRNIAEAQRQKQLANVRTQESASGRGILNSGLALKDLSDVSDAYSRQKAGYNADWGDLQNQLFLKRQGAQDQYDLADTNYLRGVTESQAQTAEQQKLADPYDWQGIDQAQRSAQDDLAAQYAKYGLAPDPTDPNNWKLAQAQQLDQEHQQYGLNYDPVGDPYNWRLTDAKMRAGVIQQQLPTTMPAPISQSRYYKPPTASKPYAPAPPPIVSKPPAKLPLIPRQGAY